MVHSVTTHSGRLGGVTHTHTHTHTEEGIQVDTVAGKVKVELSYSRHTLSILVKHVKDLV